MDDIGDRPDPGADAKDCEVSWRLISNRFAALNECEPQAVEDAFRRLTADALAWLEGKLVQIDGVAPDPGAQADQSSVKAMVVGTALLRRSAHRLLGKRASRRGGSKAPTEVLRQHPLPPELGRRLAERYGGDPPLTWLDAMGRLEMMAEGSKSRLWELVDSHPILEYVRVQCQHCGHVVPDDTNPSVSDASIGLSEEEPTDEERPLVCAGWFRGPRAAKVLVLKCPGCSAVCRWFRSTRPEVILNPNRWGRLCGEQEDLRAWLAEYFGVELRAATPLDWDHIWSEYRCEGQLGWRVLDGSARNFAARLNEGIGAWTRVLALSPDAALCGDVSEEYLSCSGGEASAIGAGDGARFGRADPDKAAHMPQWIATVESARRDASGRSTQTRTVSGHVVMRAGLSANDVTSVLRQATEDYGQRAWWQIGELPMPSQVSAP